MCGIFGYIGKQKNAASIVLSGLRSLEYRGYDSWGIAFQQSKSLIKIKKEIGKLPDKELKFPNSQAAIGHTRWATHGGVTKINAHPHFDCTHSISIIHNGIIENYSELKKILITQGHRFMSQTDSEVAAHLIESYLPKMTFTQAVRQAFLQFKGANALIVLSNHFDGMIAVKTGSPLVIGQGNDENFLASDASAIIPYSRLVYFLQDSELAEISKNKIVVKNLVSNQIKNIKFTKLDWVLETTEKGNYQHFMLKEIYQQPKILTNILSDEKSVTTLANMIKKAYGTYLVGCGTAFYACLSGSYLFSKIAKKHLNSCIGSEFGYQLDFLTDRSLVIALSQSGETMDTLESVTKAKSRGAKIASLVNVFGSTLTRISDKSILLNTGTEKAVASTKTFTAKLAYLILMAFALENSESGKKILLKAIKSTNLILNNSFISKIKHLANYLKNSSHIYVIGRGLSYPIALETALKIKEISYIHAEGMAAGELKHGSLALIEKNTPVIAFLPNDETYGATLSGAMEMKARGAYIIGLSFKNHEIFDTFFKIQDAKEATIIPNVIFSQLLAYYLTLEKGFDPDKPRNLAKSVTVK